MEITFECGNNELQCLELSHFSKYGVRLPPLKPCLQQVFVERISQSPKGNLLGESSTSSSLLQPQSIHLHTSTVEYIQPIKDGILLSANTRSKRAQHMAPGH